MPKVIYKKMNISKDEFKTLLAKMYFDDEISQAKIADNIGCNRTTIEMWFKKFRFTSRNKVELGKLTAKSVNISAKELEIIEGWLLSDGHIENSSVSGRFSIGLKYKNPIENLIQRLVSFKFTPIWESKTTNCYHVKTQYCKELLKIKNDWYSETLSDKQVPSNFILTPIKAYYWFIGDGSREKSGIKLSTDSFNAKSLNLLLSKLSDLNIHCTLRSDNRIYIRAKSLKIFYDYIGQCLDSDYLYKWK